MERKLRTGATRPQGRQPAPGAVEDRSWSRYFETPEGQRRITLDGGVAILASAAGFAERHDIRPADVVRAAISPAASWTSPKDGVCTVRAAGDIAVVVPPDDGWLVLSVLTRERAEGQRREFDARQGPRKAVRSHGASSVPDTLKSFHARLREHGLDAVLARGGHYRITRRGQPGACVTMAATTSDRRAFLNTAAQVRRVFGVDMRNPRPGR